MRNAEPELTPRPGPDRIGSFGRGKRPTQRSRAQRTRRILKGQKFRRFLWEGVAGALEARLEALGKWGKRIGRLSITHHVRIDLSFC